MFDGSKPVPRTTRWRNANNSDGNLLGLQVDSDVYRGLEDEDQLNLNDVGMEYEDEYMEYDGEHEDDRQEDDDNDKEDSIGSDDDEFVDANESESDDRDSEVEDDDEFVDAESEREGMESDNDEWDSESQHFDEDDLEAADVYNLEGMFQPIYENAKVTVCGAYCAIMKFKALSGCSFTTLGYLLQLLQLFCPSGNRLPKSVYMLRKFFKQFSASKSRQQYCSYCGTKVVGCCHNSKCPKGDPDCFISIDTAKQFQSILSRKSMYGTVHIVMSVFFIL